MENRRNQSRKCSMKCRRISMQKKKFARSIISISTDANETLFDNKKRVERSDENQRSPLIEQILFIDLQTPVAKNDFCNSRQTPSRKNFPFVPFANLRYSSSFDLWNIEFDFPDFSSTGEFRRMSIDKQRSPTKFKERIRPSFDFSHAKIEESFFDRENFERKSSLCFVSAVERFFVQGKIEVETKWNDEFRPMKVTRLMWPKVTQIVFVRLTNEFVSSSRQKNFSSRATQQCDDEWTKHRRFLFSPSVEERRKEKRFRWGKKLQMMVKVSRNGIEMIRLSGEEVLFRWETVDDLTFSFVLSVCRSRPGLPPHEVEKAESSSKNAEESGSKNRKSGKKRKCTFWPAFWILHSFMMQMSVWMKTILASTSIMWFLQV